jgi:hypothetical protein
MWARTPQERICNIDKEIESLLLKLNKYNLNRDYIEQKVYCIKIASLLEERERIIKGNY